MRETVGAVVACVVLTIVIAGCYHRGRPSAGIDPKTQAERFFAAGKAMDWKALYDLSEGASKLQTADAYCEQMKNAMKEQFFALMYYGAFTKPDFTVGGATVTGDDATVPFTWSATFSGEKMTHDGKLKMRRIQGVWMVADNKDGYASLISGEFSLGGQKLESGEWHLIPGRGAVRAVDGVPQWNAQKPAGSNQAQPSSQPAQMQQQPVQEPNQQPYQQQPVQESAQPTYQQQNAEPASNQPMPPEQPQTQQPASGGQ